MKVYVVESMGEDSVYGCYGVFSSAKKAEEFIAAEFPYPENEFIYINDVDLDHVETEKEYDIEARLREYDIKREDI